MDKIQGFLIVGLILFLVILLNLAIYFGYARKNSKNEFHYLQQTMKRARNPWEEEDASLVELSRLVATLQAKPGAEEQAQSKLKQSSGK